MNFAETAFQLIFLQMQFLVYMSNVLTRRVRAIAVPCGQRRLHFTATFIVYCDLSFLIHCVKLMFVHAVAVAAVLVAAAVATVAVAAAVAADAAVAAIDIVVDCVVVAAVPDADAAGLQLVRSLIRSLVISCGHSSCK